MGQKVNPVGLRLGINRTWDSKWFGSGPEYVRNLHEDLRIRRYFDGIEKKLVKFEKDKGESGRDRKGSNPDISKIEIVRYPGKVLVNIFTARPGVVIGRSGDKIDFIEKELKKLTDKSVHINIREIKNADVDACLVAQSIARQLEIRKPHRKVMKNSMQRSMDAGAKGIKVICAGRLGGAEMKRVESYKEGRVPLHTLRADIDFARIKAKTPFGVIGVKVWVFKGEILGKAERSDAGVPLVKRHRGAND
jgi:small subunit ribosomal protein S3